MAIKSKKIELMLIHKYLGLTTMFGLNCSDDSQSPCLDINESAPCSALSKIFDNSLSPKVTNNPNELLSPNFLKSIALTPIDRKRFCSSS